MFYFSCEKYTQIFNPLSHTPKVEKPKVHTQHDIFWENYKKDTETGKNISSVHSQDVITDCQIRNGFSMFRFSDTPL